MLALFLVCSYLVVFFCFPVLLSDYEINNVFPAILVFLSYVSYKVIYLICYMIWLLLLFCLCCLFAI